MSLVRKNIIANLIGSGWAALISIALIPLYIHFMGVEAYGLVGFYLTLQALFSILDMGLTATISRELARLSASNHHEQAMRNLVRTLELVYWAIAVLIIIAVSLLAPWLATNWLNASALSDEVVQTSIFLMGLMIALRLPYGFYSGGLLGLQRQVLLNVIKVSVETLRSGGAVLVLWLLSPSIISFFAWQLIISGIGLCLMAMILWQQMPCAKRARFQVSIFHGVWHFAAGMSGISILAVILTQADKIILSKMLSLEGFAYYALASTVAMGLYIFISPIFSAMYPRFTQLVASGDEATLFSLYHKSCQLMTVLVMPVALVICFFSEDILRIWTQNSDISSQTAPILSVLIIGTALNGMMNIPYALQLAYGWTRLAIYMNIVAVMVLIPSLIWAVSMYGALGGAMAWLALNTGYVAFGLRIMHGRLLQGELAHWLIFDFGLPVVVPLVIIMFFWLTMPLGMGDAGHVGWLILSYVSSVFVAFIAARDIRLSFFSMWRNNRLREETD